MSIEKSPVGPLVEFGFPGRLLLGSGGGGVARCVADEGPAVESLEECFGGGTGIAVDADGDRLHETEHLVVGVDPNDLGVLGPVVHVVLRQGSERASRVPSASTTSAWAMSFIAAFEP